MASSAPFIWRELHWPRPLTVEQATDLLRQWAADQRMPRLVLETRANADGVQYLLGMAADIARSVSLTARHLVPGINLTEPSTGRQPLDKAVRMRASTRHRALHGDQAERIVRAVLTALSHTRRDEYIVIQIVLGPGRVPLAVPQQTPSSVVAPWWLVAWQGMGPRLDGEKRAALRDKVSDHSFACTIRLGVHAAGKRRRALVLGLLAALRTSEAPGVQLHLRSEPPRRLHDAAVPWHWPLRLNVHELVALTGWPLGDSELPGQPPLHPRRLPPAPDTTGADRILATADMPGVTADLQLTARNATHHVHVVGPTGSGKSVLLGRLIEQDVAAGRGVVVVEPKGDLVDDVLAHIPSERLGDVVVIDPSDSTPVGLNPLASAGRRPEVVADTLLAVFRHLFGDAIGPRSGDILYAATLTLARRRDASLVMLPLLLTNAGFRRSVTAGIRDPLALEPFWASFNAWSDAERSQAIAPLMNKLRPFLLRPGLRAVLGQLEPRFSLRQVFTEKKILLVPLRKGVIGSEAANLLGGLVMAELWQAIQERATVSPARRHPVMVFADELQDYLALSTDLGDVLNQARGYGVALHAAHQHLGQLPQAMLKALRANARSTIAFQLPAADALELAKGHPELTAEDFTSLGSYEIYASLFAGGRVNSYASGRTTPPSPPISNPDQLRQASRERYGRPLDEVEAGWAELLKPATHHADSPTGIRLRRTL